MNYRRQDIWYQLELAERELRKAMETIIIDENEKEEKLASALRDACDKIMAAKFECH